MGQVDNVRSGSGALSSLPAGSTSQGANVSRWGDRIVVPWEQAMAADGRVFHVSNAARETALAVGGTSFSDTAPAFLIDVPTGTTIIPVKIKLHQGGTVAGGVITALITSDSGTRYSSAGTAHTPRNLRDDAPRTSNCSVYSGPTISANTLDVTHFAAILDQDVATAPNAAATKIDWPEPGDVPPWLYGPAALVIYTYAATTQPSWFFSFTWVELPSESVL